VKRKLSKWTLFLLIEITAATAAVLVVVITDPVGHCTNSLKQGFPQIISVHLGLNYGNSSTNYWTHLQVPECTTLYTGMQLAGWSLQTKNYGSLGVFIFGINGVEQSSTAGTYWQWYSWTEAHWSLGPVGASSYSMNNEEVIIWYLAAASASPPPPP
jgi:uncharacterized protein DUF4430